MNKSSTAPVAQESGQERSFQILDELANNDALTQRDLSQRLGIALGLVNSYIRNLVAKGYITVSTIPPKRYAYYLTPKGFAEKSRLAYDLLHDYNRIYREARQNLKDLFLELSRMGARNVIFAGADEVAEIAYISLQESELRLVGVLDGDRAGEAFFQRKIQPASAVRDIDHDAIVITSYVRRAAIHRELIALGADQTKIRLLFALE